MSISARKSSLEMSSSKSRLLFESFWAALAKSKEIVNCQLSHPNKLTERLFGLIYELHAVVIHAIVDWFHRLVLQLLTDLKNNIYCYSTWLKSPAVVHLYKNVHITLKVSMHFCLNSVTFFWLDLARHFCSLILPMTIVWFIQQLHWAVTSSVSFWHLQLIES